MIAGIDEAGRGCILGPMVLCAATIDPMDEFKLKELGVKDSKKMTPKQREEMFPLVQKICKTVVVKISAEELTRLMDRHNLNEIEAQKAAEAIAMSGSLTRVYVDSPDNVPEKFAARIIAYFPKGKKHPEIVSENKADDKYLIVGAASIVAKVVRDREIEKIKDEIGYDFNSGYTSDPFTMAFLAKHGGEAKVQKYIRHKWATLAKMRQKKIIDF